MCIEPNQVINKKHKCVRWCVCVGVINNENCPSSHVLGVGNTTGNMGQKKRPCPTCKGSTVCGVMVVGVEVVTQA